GSFESVSSSNIFKRDDAANNTDTNGSDNSDIKKLCEGFKFDNAFVQVKNGETITVTWSKGASKVWTGDIKYTESLTAVSAQVKFEAPPGAKLPQSILLRTWGLTSEGPHCTCYTPINTSLRP
ncbi:8349_t:CDS:2, partial [Funneliformis mosseae]